MSLQILLNIGLALVWMLLNNSFSFVSFVIGYSVGILLLYILRRFLKTEFYLYRILAVFKLIGVFIKEMIIANFVLAKIVISPTMKVNPGIVAYQTNLESDWEKTLLSALIGLTPGTLVTAFSDDKRTLYIHFVHIDDKDRAINDIKQSFEKIILEVTRNA